MTVTTHVFFSRLLLHGSKQVSPRPMIDFQVREQLTILKKLNQMASSTGGNSAAVSITHSSSFCLRQEKFGNLFRAAL